MPSVCYRADNEHAVNYHQLSSPADEATTSLQELLQKWRGLSCSRELAIGTGNRAPLLPAARCLLPMVCSWCRLAAKLHSRDPSVMHAMSTGSTGDVRTPLCMCRQGVSGWQVSSGCRNACMILGARPMIRSCYD